MNRTSPETPIDDDKPELTRRQLALLLLPAFGIVAGLAMILWSRAGVAVWFDSVAAMLAGCLG